MTEPHQEPCHLCAGGPLGHQQLRHPRVDGRARGDHRYAAPGQEVHGRVVPRPAERKNDRVDCRRAKLG